MKKTNTTISLLSHWGRRDKNHRLTIYGGHIQSQRHKANKIGKWQEPACCSTAMCVNLWCTVHISHLPISAIMRRLTLQLELGQRILRNHKKANRCLCGRLQISRFLGKSNQLSETRRWPLLSDISYITRIW
jgi:hypothetical protein